MYSIVLIVLLAIIIPICFYHRGWCGVSELLKCSGFIMIYPMTKILNSTSTACNAIVGPLLLAVMSCLDFCQLDVTFAFSLTSVNGHCRMCNSWAETWYMERRCDLLSISNPVYGGPIEINEVLLVFAVIILESFLTFYCGFMIPRHFSKTNQILEKLGLSAIDWQL